MPLLTPINLFDAHESFSMHAFVETHGPFRHPTTCMLLWKPFTFFLCKYGGVYFASLVAVLNMWSTTEHVCLCRHIARPPRTEDQVPNTMYQVPSTKYQVPGTRYPVPSTKYQLPSARYQNQVSSTSYQVPNTRC